MPFNNPESGMFNSGQQEEGEGTRNPEKEKRGHVQFLHVDGNWKTLKGENSDVLLHHVKQGRVELIKVDGLSMESKKLLEENGYSLIEDEIDVAGERIDVYRVEKNTTQER